MLGHSQLTAFTATCIHLNIRAIVTKNCKHSKWISRGPKKQYLTLTSSGKKREYPCEGLCVYLVLNNITSYKLVSSYEIKTTILVPKDLKPGPHPLIYHVHGGFLTTGHGLFTPLFPKWMSKLALEHSAIIVSPDHRLLPSANGVADVLEDLEDGWQWTKSELPGILRGKSPGHTLEFSQTLLVGGSAG